MSNDTSSSEFSSPSAVSANNVSAEGSASSASASDHQGEHLPQAEQQSQSQQSTPDQQSLTTAHHDQSTPQPYLGQVQPGQPIQPPYSGYVQPNHPLSPSQPGYPMQSPQPEQTGQSGQAGPSGQFQPMQPGMTAPQFSSPGTSGGQFGLGYGQPVPQPGFAPQQQISQPAEPVFSPNALKLGGITVGILVALPLVVSLLLSTIIILVGSEYSSQASFSAQMFFGLWATQIPVYFGASVGVQVATVSVFFLTALFLVVIPAFFLIRRAYVRVPVHKPLDFLITAVAAGFLSSLLLMLIVLITVSSLGVEAQKISISYIGQLFSAWLIYALVAFCAQQRIFSATRLINSNVGRRVFPMIGASLKSIGVHLALGGVVFFIAVFIVTTVKIGFTKALQIGIVSLGHLLVLGGFALLGTPLTVTYGAQVDTFGVGTTTGSLTSIGLYQTGIWWVVLGAVLMTVILLVVDAVILAIGRRGSQSWLELAVLVVTWIVISLFVMWLTAMSGGGSHSDNGVPDGLFGMNGIESLLSVDAQGSVRMSALVILIMALFALFVDLLARFAVPFIASAIPALGQKYPYLLDTRHTQRLFGISASGYPQSMMPQGVQNPTSPEQYPYSGTTVASVGSPMPNDQSGYAPGAMSAQSGYAQMPYQSSMYGQQPMPPGVQQMSPGRQSMPQPATMHNSVPPVQPAPVQTSVPQTASAQPPQMPPQTSPLATTGDTSTPQSQAQVPPTTTLPPMPPAFAPPIPPTSSVDSAQSEFSTGEESASTSPSAKNSDMQQSAPSDSDTSTAKD